METEDQWQRLSECLLTDVKEWRKAHPRATLREIEEEVQSRMSRLEAQLIQDLAQESTQQHWAGAPIDQRPACPVCHRPLHARGKRARTLQGKGGQLIKLTREYGTCPDCGTGLFPPG